MPATRDEEVEKVVEIAALIAHQIRTPLGGIELYMDVLERRLVDEESRRLLERMRGGMERMKRLVRGMLQLASPLCAVEKVETDVGVMVEDVLKSYSEEMEERSIQVKNNCQGVVLPLERDSMSMAFENVIENALEALCEGGILEVYCTSERIGDIAAVSVNFADSGDGIPLENVEDVFSPFFSLKDGGTGLGLAVVKKVVENHGGRVAAGRSGYGGALVRLILPEEG